MSTHEGVMVMRLDGPNGQHRVICGCGWVGDWAGDEDAADADFEMHLELSTDPILPWNRGKETFKEYVARSAAWWERFDTRDGC